MVVVMPAARQYEPLDFESDLPIGQVNVTRTAKPVNIPVSLYNV